MAQKIIKRIRAVDLFGWKKTSKIIGIANKEALVIFSSIWNFEEEKIYESKTTKDNLANSEGWNVIWPTKGISGRGLGFKTNHLIAPLLQGAKEKAFSQLKILEIARIDKKVNAIKYRIKEYFFRICKSTLNAIFKNKYPIKIQIKCITPNL